MKKSVLIFIGFLIGVVCLIGIYYGMQYYEKILTNANPGILNDGIGERDTSAPSSSLDNSTNWSKYENSTYKYSIKYPSSASISYFDTAGNEVKSENEKAGCAQITFDFGSIIISADSKPDYCISETKPKGYGTLKDVINIKGAVFETSGYYKETNETMNQILNIEYSEDLVIQYSIFTPNETSINFEKAKSVIEMSLKTFMKL